MPTGKGGSKRQAKPAVDSGSLKLRRWYGRNDLMRRLLHVVECCRPPPCLAVSDGPVINVTVALRPRKLWQLIQPESMATDALLLSTLWATHARLVANCSMREAG